MSRAKNKIKTKQVLIYLPSRLDLSIEVLAEETGQTKSQVCQEIIQYVVEDEERLNEVFPEEGILDQVENMADSIRAFFKKRKERKEKRK